MTNLRKLTPKELRVLHRKVIRMREAVLELVKAYDNQSASTLVSRTFEHAIEQEFGRKKLGAS